MFKKTSPSYDYTLALHRDQKISNLQSIPPNITSNKINISSQIIHPLPNNTTNKQTAKNKLIHNHSPQKQTSSQNIIQKYSTTNYQLLQISFNKTSSKDIFKTTDFKFTTTTTIKSLIAYLKQELKQQNIIFQGPSIMIDYLLTLEDQLVSSLKAQKIILKVVPLRVNSFVNNPLVNFRIIKCVGAGGFSKVFFVQAYGIYMALKVIPKKLLKENNKEIIVLSQKEILLEMIKHPFITKVHYTFQTNKYICVAMEYCPGGELFYLLKRVKRMKESQAQFYFLQILSALKALHEKGIVYRDLKPQNIILDHEGHVRLADFGLSKKLEEDITYSFCGSAQYMAPEMLLKQGHDFSIDFYCIGALLYQLVTGLPPYYCRDQQQLFNNILSNSLEFPDQKVHLSACVKSLLRGLLNKNPKKRLGSKMGIMEIFAHPWISNLSIPDLQTKKMQPPFKPDLLVYNFDDSQYSSQQKGLLQELEKESKQTNVTDLMFDDFYFESKDLKLAIENIKKIRNSQQRQSFSKQRTSKSPQSKVAFRSSYQSILSPKHYAYIKTRPLSRDQALKNPEYDQSLTRNQLQLRYSNSSHQIRKLGLNEILPYKKSQEKYKITQSRGGSLERRKHSHDIYKRVSLERSIESRQTTLHSYNYKIPYSISSSSIRLSTNQSPRRAQQDVGKIKSYDALRKGYIQKDKLKGYFNR